MQYYLIYIGYKIVELLNLFLEFWELDLLMCYFVKNYFDKLFNEIIIIGFEGYF